MTTKFLNELSKKNFISIMGGHMPTFPIYVYEDRLPNTKWNFFNDKKKYNSNKIIIEKVEYYKGIHVINENKIHNVEFDKRELDNHINIIGENNIKFSNDSNKIIIEYKS